MVSATLLPNGKAQFIDSNGVPLVGGSVYFYIPTTTTFKTTWIDPNQVTPNANPVVLDSQGQAIIYGEGQYRQVVKDSLGNTVWDQLTASTDYGALQASNNLSDVANAVTALANLGGLPISGGTMTGNLTVNGTTTLVGTTTVPTVATNDNSTNAASTAFVKAAIAAASGVGYTGFRNRFINGGMLIDQRNGYTSQTITANTQAYTVDRLFATCQGANITGQSVAGSGVTGATGDNRVYQLFGTAGITSAAVGQRIESYNIYDLAGTTVTFSAKIANTLLTTVNWTAAYPSSQDNWTTYTTFASGSFTVTSTLQSFSAQIALPNNCQNGLQVSLSVGNQTSGVLSVTEYQVESGSVRTPFEVLPIGLIQQLCYRYYEAGTGTAGTGSNHSGGGVVGGCIYWKATKMSSPTVSVSSTGGGGAAAYGSATTTSQGITITAVNGNGQDTFAYTASAEL